MHSSSPLAGMQPASASQLVHSNKLHGYHRQWTLRSHQYRDIEHFHLLALDYLKTPEPAHLISVQH
jgi:hypothetical protein